MLPQRPQRVPQRLERVRVAARARQPRHGAAVRARGVLPARVRARPHAIPHLNHVLGYAAEEDLRHLPDVEPAASRDVGAVSRKQQRRRAEAVGAKTLEGCMASSIDQARNGTLYLMCGGKRSVFNSVKPILDALSVDLRYIGTAGKAAQVKALVNMVMNINTAGLAEVLGLGKALGLDLKVLMEVFSQTGANSRVLETDGTDMIIRDHECYFSADHAAKDSGIALKMASGTGVNLPMAKASRNQFARMGNLGLGDLDKSGVAELTFPGRKGSKARKK